MYAESEVEEKLRSSPTITGLAPGTRLFQRFTLQKALAQNETANLWLAHDDELDRLVALRLLPEAAACEAGAHEKFKRDSLRSLRLIHPNIARVFGLVEDSRGAAISMEYIDGSTLSTLRLQKRANCFSVSEIAPWVTALCDALGYAHDSAGLVHGDLKPSNLMVNSRMELKVTDFGIPSAFCSANCTLNYLSPQQMLGEDPRPSDDIYALGATLYELLSSKPPFFDGDVAAQVRESSVPWVAVRRSELGIVGEAVPKFWEETITACLAKNPKDRPRTAVEIANRLHLGGTISLVAAQQDSKMRGLIRSLTHARMVGAAAGVAALVAAAILAARSHPRLANVAQAAQEIFPDSYAIELLRPDASRKPLLAPDSITSDAGTSAPKTTGAKNGALQLATTPPGGTFAIFPGVVVGQTPPGTVPLHAGVAPDAVEDLPPGRYTLFFQNDGWPEERTEISLEAGETLPVAYVFAHGSVSVTSTPDGAEIFLGARALGTTPLTVDLPLGKQQLTARYPDRAERMLEVNVDNDTPAAVAFQLHPASDGVAKRKAKPPESTLGKIGQTLKNVFTRKPPPRKKS